MPEPTGASSISATTRYCAVFGHPIIHSASPALQNAAIAATGLDWRYLAFDVNPTDLQAAISGARAQKYIGLNLTVPHKLLAVPMMDVLHESAKTWGAVNTVSFEGKNSKGAWLSMGAFGDETPAQIRAVGYNTDADAITRSLREDLDLQFKNASVLILGCGGAARTAALKLASEGIASLHLVNRTQSKAAELASELGKRFPGVKVQTVYPTATVDLMINATSLGLNQNDPLPLDESQFAFSRARAVYDMIYRPAETPFLKRANAAGCRTANGLGMLLHQGAAAFEIWSGKAAPLEVMRKALEQEVYGH